ncbi:hypothetical protein RJ640_007095 [Escallonia rubra]|uniref:Uncharacterized protein n=1 Tax=Escallonia rubra TaxID=112253 RepID=A0AA88RGF1_9ASTE|nr:hypothetical protein RJ640_007095 [Escallonia rubra]
MVAMVLKARMSDRSGLEPRFCHRPNEDDRKSLVTPLGFEITVESPPSVRSGLVGPPTRTGSLSPDSFANVLHSDVSSIECDSKTSPHSEHTVSPAEWSNTTSVLRLQSEQYASAMERNRCPTKLLPSRANLIVASIVPSSIFFVSTAVKGRSEAAKSMRICNGKLAQPSSSMKRRSKSVKSWCPADVLLNSFDFSGVQTDKVRLEIEKRRKRNSRRIIAAVEYRMMTRLRAKEEEIEKIGKLNWALEERVKSLCVENQICRDLAQTNEATANALRSNLEHVLAAQVQEENHHLHSGNEAQTAYQAY